MNTRAAKTGIFAFAALAVASTSASAIPTAGQLKNTCAQMGGQYGAPSKHGVYYCLLPDGSGVVCGGVGPYYGTCGVLRRVPTKQLPPWVTNPRPS